MTVYRKNKKEENILMLFIINNYNVSFILLGALINKCFKTITVSSSPPWKPQIHIVG